MIAFQQAGTWGVTTLFLMKTKPTGGAGVGSTGWQVPVL